MLDEIGLDDLVALDAVVVLRRDQHRAQPHGLAVDVVEGDLRLAVGPEVRHRARPAHLGEAFGHAVREVDRQRHEHVGLVARVAEHHSLVAGALLVQQVLARRAAAHLFGVVHALRDVGRLLVERHHHADGRAVVAVGLAVVADRVDRFAHDAGDVDVALRRDLAADDREAGRHERLARDPTLRVLGQDGVEDGVGDLIGHLVGMSLGHRFRGEGPAGHVCSCCHRVPNCRARYCVGPDGHDGVEHGSGDGPLVGQRYIMLYPGGRENHDLVGVVLEAHAGSGDVVGRRSGRVVCARACRGR